MADMTPAERLPGGEAALFRPFDPRSELLTPEAWPVPSRIPADAAVVDGTDGTIASPWLDFAPLDSPDVPSRKVAPVLARECEIAVYYDRASGTITYGSIVLILESMRLYSTRPIGANTPSAPLTTLDIAPQMSSLNGGFFSAFAIPPRIFRARVVWTNPAVTVTTNRIVLALSFDKLRFRTIAFDPSKKRGEG